MKSIRLLKIIKNIKRKSQLKDEIINRKNYVSNGFKENFSNMEKW